MSDEPDDFDSLTARSDAFPFVDEEDRSHLISVICRLRRILNWDENMEEQVHERTRGPLIIRDLLQYFQQWKRTAALRTNETEATGFQHLITYSLAKLCFFYWIRDSNLVREVLSHVYNCDGHFSPFFSYIVGREDRNNYFWRANSNGNERDHQALLFFLHHAYKSNLEFSGVRFIDLSLRQPLHVPPVILACVYGKPKPLLLLLRYGANLCREPFYDGPPHLRSHFSDDWDVPLLLRHLMRILWTSLGNDLRNEEAATMDVVVTNSTGNIIQCINIMLRVIIQVRLGELDFTLTSFEHGLLIGTCSSHEFIRRISRRRVVPRLAARYLHPAELKHLCRCSIRTWLNSSWNLPAGILKLPLPRTLIEYVDLAGD